MNNKDNKRTATTLCSALPDYYHTGLFSDVTLRFFNHYHAAAAGPVLELRMHKFVLYSGSVPVLTNMIDARYGDLKADQCIKIELDFETFEVELVRFFFSLIYHNKLHHAIARSPKISQALDRSITHLHQLALYFGYVALRDICYDRMCRLFSPETVGTIRDYCMHPLSLEQGGGFHVPDDKRRLYDKLIQWEKFCRTSSPSDESSGIRYASDLASCHIFHVRRVCTACLTSPQLVHRKDHGVIDMGTLASLHDPCERWSFSMMHRLGDNVNMMLFLKHQRRSDCIEDSYSSSSSDEHMAVECHDGARRVRTRVSLFSKNSDDDRDEQTTTTTTTTSEINVDNDLCGLTCVNSFRLRINSEDCYESKCDCCQREAPVYIFSISVEMTTGMDDVT
jgi:hypothetical protein